VSKRTFYDHFSSKNDLVEEYLRRIHHAGGMPSEQAIDTADASPRATDPYRLGNPLAVLFEGAKALTTSLNDTSPAARTIGRRNTHRCRHH
jgi:AcrR family transcriptional regulator